MAEVAVTADCKICGKHFEDTVPAEALNRFKSGAPVQEAFSFMSLTDRELFFISGFCGACWDNIFNPFSN